MLKKINIDQNSCCFRWVGNGECFLFSIQPKMAIFHSTGKVSISIREKLQNCPPKKSSSDRHMTHVYLLHTFDVIFQDENFQMLTKEHLAMGGREGNFFTFCELRFFSNFGNFRFSNSKSKSFRQATLVILESKTKNLSARQLWIGT